MLCMHSHMWKSTQRQKARVHAPVVSPQTVYLLQCVLHHIAVRVPVHFSSDFVHPYCRRRLCLCCSVLQCVLHGVAVCVATCVSSELVHYSVSADCICVALCVAVCITPCCSVSCNVRFIGVRASAVSPQKVHMSQCALQCMLQRVHFVFLESSCICGSAAASVFVESTQSSSTQIRVFVNHHSYMYLS